MSINDSTSLPWKMTTDTMGRTSHKDGTLKMYRPIVVILFILLTLAALVEIGLISLC